MKTTEKLREGLGRAAVHAAGQIRRMAISLTSQALWQLTGFKLLDGAREAFPAEPFLGIGFHARPSSSGKPEAIVLMPGDDSKGPVVVAVRDEKTRQAIAGALAGDETAMFNSLVIAIAKANGTFEVRSKLGTAKLLALLEDLQELADVFDNWTPAAGDGGAALKTLLTTLLGSGWPRGTTKLKGE